MELCVRGEVPVTSGLRVSVGLDCCVLCRYLLISDVSCLISFLFVFKYEILFGCGRFFCFFLIVFRGS